MAQSEWQAIVGPSYRYSDYPIDSQECVNFEAVRVNSDAARSRKMLIGTPGRKHLRFRLGREILDEIPHSNGGFIRGIHRCQTGFFNSTVAALVAVVGTKVWEVGTPDDELVCGLREVGDIGDMDNGSRVVFADSGNRGADDASPKLVISDGNLYWVCDMAIGSGFSALGGDIAWNHPTDMAYLDGRTYSCGPDSTNDDDTQQSDHVYWSAIYQPDKWDGSYVSASVTDDPVVALEVVENYLWMIGTESFEIWQTCSSEFSPIQRVKGGQNGVGTISGKSVASIAGDLFFVGGGPTGFCSIYKGNGTRIDNIATDAMKEELARYGTLKDAVGFCYSESGRRYYVVTFPSQDVTWVYNIVDECWHRRALRDSRDIQHHWNIASATVFGETVIASEFDGCRLFKISRDFFDDDGARTVRYRRCPHIVKDERLLKHNSLTVGMRTGTGLPYSAVKEDMHPRVMLGYVDGTRNGKTGLSLERWQEVGRAGATGTRVKWNRLGTSRDRVYELRVSAAVPWCIYDAWIDTDEATGGL